MEGKSKRTRKRDKERGGEWKRICEGRGGEKKERRRMGRGMEGEEEKGEGEG